MALQVSNVNVKSGDGDAITSFWIKIDTMMTEKPNPSILLTLRAYRSETDYDNGYDTLMLKDTGQGLATDVPGFLSSISDALTVGQYANVDMTQIQNRLRDVLIEGDSHADWADLFGSQVWAGFGVGNVVTEMPV